MSAAEPDAAARPSLFAAAALTYGTNIGAAVLSLANVLIVSRALGPHGRGDIAFLIAIGALTSNLSAFGIQEANANVGGVSSHLRPTLATNSVLFAFAFGAVSAGVATGLTVVFPAAGGEVARGWLLVTLACVPILILKIYLQFLIQSDYGFGVTNLAWIAGPSTTLVTNGFLGAAGWLSVGSAITAWLVGQAIGAGILIVYVKRHYGFGPPSMSLATTSIRFGLKTHLGRFMTLGNYRVDQWFVGAISGSQELGFYSVAVAWAEVLYYIPGVLVLVQRPDLVRAGREQAARLAARVFRIALLISVTVAGLLIVLAPFLCTTVFGGQFRGSVDQLRLLALSAFGIVALELLGSALIAQRRPMLATSAVAVAFVATITLDVVLIPPLGGAGAAIATSAAWTVGGLTELFVFRRVFAVSGREFLPARGDVAWVWSKIRGRVGGRRTDGVS